MSFNSFILPLHSICVLHTNIQYYSFIHWFVLGHSTRPLFAPVTSDSLTLSYQQSLDNDKEVLTLLPAIAQQLAYWGS